MRYNIFNKAHLQLKTSLIKTCISIGESINGEACAVASAVKKVGETLAVFDEQISFETLHILPFVFEYEPSIWNNYTTEHNKATKLSNNLHELVKTFYKQKRKEDKYEIMTLISDSFNEFVLFNFNHMDDEEAVLNEILWRYYQDKDLIQIEEKMEILPHLVGKSSPGSGFQIATAA